MKQRSFYANEEAKQALIDVLRSRGYSENGRGVLRVGRYRVKSTMIEWRLTRADEENLRMFNRAHVGKMTRHDRRKLDRWGHELHNLRELYPEDREEMTYPEPYKF